MPFTGRDEERRQLGELWRATESGGFRLAIVSGEAGIGKTRLASELARGVDDGATVLAGRCDDELDVPCQPFVEALRHFLHHCPPAYLRDELGTEARELVRLAPELADRFPDLVPAPATDAETARYRMFEAVAAWLVAASGPEPILRSSTTCSGDRRPPSCWCGTWPVPMHPCGCSCSPPGGTVMPHPTAHSRRCRAIWPPPVG